MNLTDVSAPTTKVQQVQSIFQKFGQGDVPGILAMCSDDCDWQHGGDASAIPFAKPFFGKQGVGEFFQSVVQSIRVSQLETSNYQERGNVVSHDFHIQATVNATGKSYTANVRYEWTFNDQGKICKQRSSGDFSEAEAAFR